MKISHIRTLLLTAVAGATLSAPDTRAALAYNDGDIFLGFRATSGAGSSTGYLVNLGSIANFLNATGPVSLSLGGIDSDLDTIFGTNWSSRPEMLWGISGVQFSAGNGLTNRTLIATQSQAFPLTLGTPNSTAWNRATLSTQGAPALKIQSLATKFALGSTGSVDGVDQIESEFSAVALVQPNSQANSFRSFMPGGVNSNASSAFFYFSDADGIEGNFGAGASATALDLYVMQAGSGPGTYEGTFTIGSNAEITFIPQGVPEPSGIMMLSAGATVLGLIRRRQRA